MKLVKDGETVRIRGKAPNKIKLAISKMKEGEKLFVSQKEWKELYSCHPSQALKRDGVKTYPAMRGSVLGYEFTRNTIDNAKDKE